MSQEVNMANLFLTLSQTCVCDINLSQHPNKEFDIKGIKYLINEEDIDYLPSESVDAHFKDPKPSSFKCSHDMTKVKQLQQQDTHIAEIVTQCKSIKLDKTLYYLDEHGIVYWKIKDGSNIFHAIMMPQILLPYILYESHKALGHKGSTRLYNFIKWHYYWKRLWQHCNKYVRPCPKCQQFTLKELHYVDSHLPIRQLPMSFISMNLLGPYHETGNGNQYDLTIICMLTNYVFMIPI